VTQVKDIESNNHDDGPDIGWARAIGSGLAILVVGFFATVYAADALVTNLSGVSRSTRQYVASAVFLVLVLVLAWVLRRLQARRLI
jgi:membrane protein implicated in regulation of membrane protease activity